MISCSYYMLDNLSDDFKVEEQLKYYLDEAIYKDIRDLDRNNYVLEVSPIIYEKMQRNFITHDVKYIERFMGILVSINETLLSNQIRVRYERGDKMDFTSLNGGLSFQTYFYKEEDNHKLPDKVIFNKKKNATTLLFGDKVIVVKKNENDKEDFEKAFLWAYFIHKSGLSKTQASKYIDKIMEELK